MPRVNVWLPDGLAEATAGVNRSALVREALSRLLAEGGAPGGPAWAVTADRPGRPRLRREFHSLEPALRLFMELSGEPGTARCQLTHEAR